MSTFTFGVLKQNETLSTHDRQQQAVVQLSSLEEFYTDVSLVYDNDNDENDDEDDNETENEAMFLSIIDDLDKSRYQLDEICRVVDLLTTNKSNKAKNELSYKLGRALIYRIMDRRHLCAISQQKCHQFNKCVDILKNGIQSLNKCIAKTRTFSRDLVALSKYWRLTTLGILKMDDEMILCARVFIDYRLHRSGNGLLPLRCNANNGSIEIDRETHRDVEKEAESENENDADIIGFDDDDDDDDVDGDADDISQYIYHSQIHLLYEEILNALRVESAHWNPQCENGISCSLLDANAIIVHTPSFDDFAIQFYCNADALNKWNGFAIKGINEKLSKEIEEAVINMLCDNTHNECRLLQYIVTKINHHRLSSKMKTILKSFSQHFRAFNIKWNQLNSKSIVNVAIFKHGKLLLHLTLNSMKITVIKYSKQCSKSIPLHSMEHLRKVLHSFTKSAHNV